MPKHCARFAAQVWLMILRKSVPASPAKPLLANRVRVKCSSAEEEPWVQP